MTIRTVAVVALLALGLAHGSPVRAEDDPAQVEGGKALVAEMAASRKAKDAGAFGGQAKKAVELHNAIEDKGVRGKLQKELGAGLKERKFDGIRIDLIGLVAELNDSKGAYKLIKRFMPDAKVEEITDEHKAALAAVDKLAPEGALKLLGDLAEKAKSHDIGALAIAALGSFKDSKKRTSILEDLVKLIGRFMPPSGTQVGAATEARWKALASPLILACNELTGQKVRDPNEWLQLWKDNKKKPANLFINDS